VVCTLVNVPNEPSVGQLVGEDVFEVVPVTVVVVYWQGWFGQLTLVFVAPVTVAVMVVDCPRMMVFPTEEESVTVTTLAVELLPHPFNEKSPMAASPRPRKLDNLRTLIPTISPTQWRGAYVPLAPALFLL
jgi:hypothetical protein